MDSEANQVCSATDGATNESQSNVSQPDNKVIAEQQSNLKAKEATPEDDSDDALDDDISSVEIASSLLDDTLALDDPELVIPDNINEAYKNIMSVCSSTAQDIKKSITDVLNSREGVVITEVEETTTALQASLNQKIADFELAVSGCLSPSECNPSSTPQADEKSAEVSPCSDDGLNAIPDQKKDSEENDGEKVEAVGEFSGKLGAEPELVTVKETDTKDSKPNIKKSEIDSAAVSAEKFIASRSLKEMLHNPIIPEEEKSLKKQKNSASKKKGEKNMDQILKSLGNGTAEEKLKQLCKIHADTLEECRLIEPRFKQLERQIISQQRDKEQLQAEHNRVILAKSRLEGLCREMQRQSKAVKEERKEIANKFQTTLNDISALMQENSKKNIKLREENAELATKLKSLVDNYDVWEQNMSKVVQQKELEAQLAKAKHAKVNLLLKQETEKFLREKQSLLENLSDLQQRCTLLTTNELQLRTELNDYTSKYEEFQTVLTSSSKVFATFKNDMETTSKKIKKLEKETNLYKQKWTSSNNALLDMISHKEKQDKEFSNAQQRILTLEKLCRALQAERNELQNQLNVCTSSAVSTTPDVPSLAPETPVP